MPVLAFHWLTNFCSRKCCNIPLEFYVVQPHKFRSGGPFERCHRVKNDWGKLPKMHFMFMYLFLLVTNKIGLDWIEKSQKSKYTY